MTAIRRPFRLFRLRNRRGLLAACLAITYLLSGVLHTCQCLDVTNPFGQLEIAAASGPSSGDADSSDSKTLAAHHCHGCFSVVFAQLLLPDAMSELVAASNPPRLTVLAGVVPDTDSPPPKRLT
ncbi:MULTISPECIES: hypothetical protein [unclassified Bradyrhizobium]|uniref:hypothetical protein n=1 Tax=unclassified Bradyrhizobium TaxID=2631580 RepID=UPI0009E2393B|nr:MULTISPECIES: hypothetical protein [unclassified Bradyrhizobium]